MGGNYEKNMYNQLCELMAKVDSLEADHKENRKEIRRLNNEISSLNNENRKLRGIIDKQNQGQSHHLPRYLPCGPYLEQNDKESCYGLVQPSKDGESP